MRLAAPGDSGGSAVRRHSDCRRADGGDALGEAVPPDPPSSGTMAGDVFFNTNTTFTADKLTSVAMMNRAMLGLAPEPGGSIMFNDFTGRKALGATDIGEFQAVLRHTPCRSV